MAQITTETSKRNIDVDVVKGMAIVLMVIGHCGPLFSRYIYLFHMAVFFIASGYCEYGKVIDGKVFVLKKVKSLWTPFAVYNGTFTLLNNLFCYSGIYSTDTNILNLASGQKAAHVYSLKETLWMFIKNVFFLGEPQMGGSWFLKTMFTVQFAYLIIYLISQKGKNQILLYITFLISAVIAGFIDRESIELPFRLHAFFAAYVAFSLGLFIKKWKSYEKLYINKGAPVIAVFFLGVMGNFNAIEMIDGKIGNPTFFIVCSLTGWLLLMSIAKYCPLVVKKLFCYINKHAVEILMLHFLAFKIVTAIVIATSGASWRMLAIFPVLPDFGRKYWYIYTIVGVFAPVLYGIVLSKIRRMLSTIMDGIIRKGIIK